LIYNFTYSNIEAKIYINAYPEDDLNSLNVGMLGWSISMADGLLDRFNLSGTGWYALVEFKTIGHITTCFILLSISKSPKPPQNVTRTASPLFHMQESFKLVKAI
jgi:hypothetical protein